jgi:hypothetical protein
MNMYEQYYEVYSTFAVMNHRTTLNLTRIHFPREPVFLVDFFFDDCAQLVSNCYFPFAAFPWFVITSST